MPRRRGDRRSHAGSSHHETRRANVITRCVAALLAILRWTFIVIGAVTASSVLFTYLYHVNESIYDPSLFAIGVGGLFTVCCAA